ncbi:bifunctional [glutamine synthetase] adenylyltransferase/[glutamine synthetase]-adenylyl-L-tyrosine phosphorylase [soil metagenome]
MSGRGAGLRHLGHLDEAVERSPAPAAVRVALERLEAAHPGLATTLDGDEALRSVVLAVVAASRSLTLLLETDLAALDQLGELTVRRGVPRGDELDDDSLRRWKALEYLRIAARDLCGVDSLVEVTAALAELATDVLVASSVLAGAEDLVVVGMGKLGGSELNYASDIDIMFVGGEDADTGPTGAGAAARRAMGIARRCFRVDANLRPEGRDGPLVRSVASYRAYWERWASPWEFQALLKARPLAGPPELVTAFAASASDTLWTRALPPDDLRSLRAMKARTEAEVARKGLDGRELKRGAGGIRDIEFAVQLLQLVHGRHDPALRSPNTLDALAELARAGYLAASDGADLDEAYRFLRTVEHRVQLMDERQVHTVPAANDERDRLARVLGFRGSPEGSALTLFDADLARCRVSVRSIHERLYFRPLLEAFTGTNQAPLGPEATEARLAAFGFTDAERTRQAVAELTRGLTRSSRLMHQLLPLLLGWLAESPDPDQGLLGLRSLASGSSGASELVRAFRESAETARRLCIVLGTSQLLGNLLRHNPDLIPALGNDDALRADSGHELAEQAATSLRWRAEAGHGAALKRFKERTLTRVAVRDVLGLADVESTATNLTTLAEATLVTAVQATQPSLPFTVIALGRFGGGELSYASDLDVVFVYDGSTTDDFAEAERVASGLLHLLKGATPASRIYCLDADLRPEGRQGPLARSLDGYRAYFERWAALWERQAMSRARVVAGDAELGRRFLNLLAAAVWGHPLDGEGVREIRRMKARIERERLPAGEDPQFHLKLGRGSLSDVEFCVQLLQLQHQIPSPGTMTGLSRLVEANVMDVDDAAVLSDSYRFCERTRNRLYLLRGAPGDSLPRASEELARLARSLDTAPVELREHYRRVTRRARMVIERLFYGRGT